MKKHKETCRRRAQKRRYVVANRQFINYKNHQRMINNLKTWINVLPVKTECQCCGKEIGFLNKKSPICFDHRNDGSEIIKIGPASWLSRNRWSPLNERIWKMCDFGMLCRRCNSALPTKDRAIFLQKAIIYLRRQYGKA